jgi:hypothetical protein
MVVAATPQFWVREGRWYLTMVAVDPAPVASATTDLPPTTPRERRVFVMVVLGLLLGPVLLLGWYVMLESSTSECTADPPGQMNQWEEVGYDRSWWPLFITCVIDPSTSRERQVSVPWESRPDCPTTRRTCPG